MMNEQLQERYEDFEGELRKLDELIGQLELWSDEYAHNHKKEEVRLPQYIELNNNLEMQKSVIQAFLEERQQEEGLTEKLQDYKEQLEEKLTKYEPTEEEIHRWVREIKNVQILIMKSDILQENEAYIEAILKNN